MSELQDDGAGGNGQDEAAAFASPAKRLRRSPAPEPTSVLYNRSPSPPTSSSLASSSAPEPPPISAEDWEVVLSGGDMAAPPAAARSQDTSFLRWIMDADAQVDAFDPFLPPPPCQETAAVEPFLHPQPQFQFPVAEEDLGPGAAVDELLEAAHRADTGDSTGALEILARLNHRLPSPPGHPHPPLLRAAAHLRDALLRLVVTPAPGTLQPGSVSTPLDVVLKVAAHRALADASPTVQFASFTSTQALLDALGGARRVHVVDLDVGFGGRWAPLMQELALQWRRAPFSPLPLPLPCLKVTALVSPGSAHPLELRLTHEGLTRFAAELGISFEFNAVVFDPLDTFAPTGLSVAPGDAVAVHLPIGSGAPSPALPTTLRVVKQLRPAIVVCVDHGCHRGDLPLSHHALNVVRSSAAFLESLDAAGAPADAVARLEQYVLRPRVERLLLGDRMPPWQTMLASAGFALVQLSNAAEAQAECLVGRTPTPGFHVEKRQAALALRWQESELVTVSAWRC
ncbi:unnamed protein product [Miscanthus lutarioriparius]|uniref:Scarecrow-like protein 6 n=1 Tax=Miscanthus lutarioriparius TaxID=422564 RepID=A0A811S743_9POAL|nr:unnamed protein product [Miscanthus lutarioriparius]